MAADREVGGAQVPPRPEPKVRLGVGFLAYNEEELIAKTVAEAVDVALGDPEPHLARRRRQRRQPGPDRRDRRRAREGGSAHLGRPPRRQQGLRGRDRDGAAQRAGRGRDGRRRRRPAHDGRRAALPRGDRPGRRRRLLLEEGPARPARPARSSRGACACCRTGSWARRSTTSTPAAGPSGEDVARRIEIKHRINFVGDEIYVRCRIAGWKVTEVVVRHFPREAGQSIHRPFKMLGTIAAGDPLPLRPARRDAAGRAAPAPRRQGTRPPSERRHRHPRRRTDGPRRRLPAARARRGRFRDLRARRDRSAVSPRASPTRRGGPGTSRATSSSRATSTSTTSSPRSSARTGSAGSTARAGSSSRTSTSAIRSRTTSRRFPSRRCSSA